MELQEVVSHGLSAAGGSVTVGWIAKVLIQNWIKNHDKRTDKTGDAMQSVAVELAGIKVELTHLKRAADIQMGHGENIAVLTARVGTMERNLNGIGQKLRSLKP